MPDLLFLLPILVFLCLEGLFSGGEIALVACDINIVRQKGGGRFPFRIYRVEAAGKSRSGFCPRH